MSNETGLIVMSNLCCPKHFKPILSSQGVVPSLGSYAGLVFGAVRAMCVNATIIMLYRQSDADIPGPLVSASRGARPLVIMRLADLPFKFAPKACNHTDETEYTIASCLPQLAYISPGICPSRDSRWG